MKKVFVILHVLLLTLCAYQGAGLFYQKLFSGKTNTVKPASDRPAPEAAEAARLQELPAIEKYSMITRRNLFEVMVRKPVAARADAQSPVREDPLPETRPRLALWGTIITASGEGEYAVIENQKDKTQALFQKGDSIEGALIKDIQRSRVVLSVNGQDQVLEVDISQQSSVSPGIAAPASVPAPHDQMTESVPPGFDELNPVSVMKQVRVRPYASPEGTQGLLLYAVKKDAMVQQLGLQNGDVIQFVNDSPTRSGQDMATLYSALADAMSSPSDSRFIVMRQGETKEIIYDPRNNTYTVSPAAEKTGPEEKP